MPPRTPSNTLREALLADAATTISGDRDQQYGPPTESFTKIAALWSALFGVEFTPTDVALALSLVKHARLATGGPDQRDSWLDIAGYAACGHEVSQADG